MGKYFLFTIIYGIAVASLTSSVFAAEVLKGLVTRVEVRQNRLISTETILSKVETRVGAEFSQRILNEDVKRLYATGFFTDVSVELERYKEGLKVIFIVTERPIIERIVFEGNRLMKRRKLESLMRSEVGQTLDYRQLREDVEGITRAYEDRGMHLAEVEYKVELDKETNRATIYILIDEATLVRIKKISIEGNKEFSDRKILKLMDTRRDTIFTSGFFKKDVLVEDLEKIIAVYRRAGYMDVKVTPKLRYDKTRKKMYITINIEEGKRYMVGQINVSGNKVLTEEEIRQRLKMVSGSTFSQDDLRRDISEIQGYYYAKGFVSASVISSSLLNEKTGRVDVTYKIAEGEITFIEKIRIEGNIKTRDVVIRRELKVRPGERFDGDRLQRSRERLYNLGYFEEVSFDIEPGSTPNKKDLIVRVREAKTGEFSFGAGYSSIDRFVGFVNILQRNFDITNFPSFTGGGQRLRLRAEFGTEKQDYELSFTEPWVFDKPVLFGFDLYNRTKERERYDEARRGGDLRLGRAFGEYARIDLTYKLEDVKIFKILASASPDIWAEEGVNTISSLTSQITRDTRDNVFDPTKGGLLIGSIEYAGSILGADKDFVKYVASSSWYFPCFERFVLELRLRAGIVDSFLDTPTVPLYERFYAGGAYTIRGYEERSVGPKDARGDPVGGNTMLVANAEYTLTIVENIKGAIFYDVGNVWRESGRFEIGEMKSSVGLGVRIKTPIGPIRLDYGYGLDYEPGEEKGRFHFTMSHGF